MKRKLLFFLFAFCLIQSNANAANKAVGITFWLLGSSGNHTDQEVLEMVCAINDHYNNNYYQGVLTPGNISFYADNIFRVQNVSGSPWDYQVMTTYGLVGQINVYVSSSAPGNANSTQYPHMIYMNVFGSDILTHEIGHLFGLTHTGNGSWMDPGASSGFFSSSQLAQVNSAISTMGWGSSSGTAALQWAGPMYQMLPMNIHFYSVYQPVLGTQYYGDITFSYSLSNSCSESVLPNRIKIDVYSGCPVGTNEYMYTVYASNMNIATTIAASNDVDHITCTYYYPNTSFTNSKTFHVGYHGPVPVCSISIPDPKSRMANNFTNANGDTHYLRVINKVVQTSIKLEVKGFSDMIMVDNTGRLVKAIKVKDGFNEVDVAGLAAGVYMVRSRSGSEEVHCKFVKL